MSSHRQQQTTQPQQHQAGRFGHGCDTQRGRVERATLVEKTLPATGSAVHGKIELFAGVPELRIHLVLNPEIKDIIGGGAGGGSGEVSNTQ